MNSVSKLRKADAAVLLALLVFVIFIFGFTTHYSRELARRTVCAENLKSLGAAHVSYALDYDDMLATQGGKRNREWGNRTDEWQNSSFNWWYNVENEVDPGQYMTIGASLYLLVREADVSPSEFVCPSSNQKTFELESDDPRDLNYIWDFGVPEYNDTGPANCVSYAYHMPYSVDGNPAYPVSFSESNSNFAIMADRNPWYDSNIRRGIADPNNWEDRVGLIEWNDNRRDADWKLQVGNSYAHLRDGQNVLYTDGRVEFSERPDVGYLNDNIYTSQGSDPNEIDNYRMGWMPEDVAVGKGYPTSSTDSFLANDDNRRCPTDLQGDLNRDCSVDMKDFSIFSWNWLKSAEE